MTKPNRTIYPSKFLPLGSRRITNKAGERVWIVGGKEYASKAEYFQYLADKRMVDKTAAQAAPEPSFKEGDKVLIKDNLVEECKKLGIEEVENLAELQGTIQTVFSVWQDEKTKQKYATIDLCVEIPFQCMEIFAVEPPDPEGVVVDVVDSTEGK